MASMSLALDARAARLSRSSSLVPSKVRLSVNVSLFWVMVPVLSKQKVSMDAASSIEST